MIEKKFVKDNLKEFHIHEYLQTSIASAGYSSIKIKRTPLGDKVVIAAAKPGLVVGRKGANIKEMTQVLKKDFDLENPQVELADMNNPFLDARVVCERICDNLARFGPQSFKRTGYAMLEAVMRAGAYGVEILISGKIPGARAKTWRFNVGYMKKSGSVAQTIVDHCIRTAEMKTGTIGIQVRILPPVQLPDTITYKDGSDLTKERIDAAKAAGPGLPKGDDTDDDELDVDDKDVEDITGSDDAEEVEDAVEDAAAKGADKSAASNESKAADDTSKESKENSKKTEAKQ